MTLFSIGQSVRLSNKSDMVFLIIAINPDLSYHIQYQCSVGNVLDFNNISAEMMRLVEDQDPTH